METAIVVEPRKQRQRLITRVLREQGIASRVYDKPESAAKNVKVDTPDLIIVDLVIPSQSGEALVEKLKALDVKVILLTAEAPTSKQLSHYSTFEVLEAPLNRSRLAARISQLREEPSKTSHLPVTGSVRPLTMHVLPELHEFTKGRLDAGRIAEYLGTPLSTLSKSVERSVAGVHKSPSSSAIQLSLAPIARSIAILARLLGTREKVRIWMNSPHPDLEGRTPLSVIVEGKASVVTEMLESALAGQPA